MLAGHDRIVDNARTMDYFSWIPADVRQIYNYPEGHHTLEFDPDPGIYARDLIEWLGTYVTANQAGSERVVQA
jgi:hypothetical protein